MEEINVQTSGNSPEPKQKKKRNKKLTIIISVIAAVIVIAAAVVSYVYLYKIPHDQAIANYNEAVANYNDAREQYDAAELALDGKNKELDDKIMSLTQVINTENIPIDEFLLAEPNAILDEARKIPRDSAPAIPEMPVTAKEITQETTENIETVTAEIIVETSKILELIPDVEAMGDYSDTLELLSSTETKYQTMIDEFKSCEANVVWFSVDEDATVLRFLVEFNNPNPYPLRGVTTEWTAYDKNDAIVGSYDGTQPDLPANGSAFYVGGAGSANLSGTPARVEVKITYDGLLTNRDLPQITVSNAQIKNNGFGWFTASADCITNADIQTVDLDGQFIIKDADGQVIDADFWSADNLPDSIDANGRFTVSEDFFDLPTKPETVEVYMYYIMQ